MMNCEEAAHLIDRNDWKELSLKEKLNLRMHNAMCGRCRGYKKFSHILKSLFGDITSAQECLSYDEKEEMKKKIKSST
ncbi:MAG: hypothetical protein ABF258_01805 [Flavobacteriales bacterium]